jgi:hypothetical protein
MSDRSPLITLLKVLGYGLPGDYLKTFVYRTLIARPRKALRAALEGFYRIDHIYDVLEDAREHHANRCSILEFGTGAGYAFTRMLYATRYLGMEDRVAVHTFDAFTGLRAPTHPADQGSLPAEQYYAASSEPIPMRSNAIVGHATRTTAFTGATSRIPLPRSSSPRFVVSCPSSSGSTATTTRQRAARLSV